MDRKTLEKLAWRATHKDFKSAWNKGDCTLLKFVAGKGTCLVHISQFSEAELLAIAMLMKKAGE